MITLAISFIESYIYSLRATDANFPLKGGMRTTQFPLHWGFVGAVPNRVEECVGCKLVGFSSFWHFLRAGTFCGDAWDKVHNRD